MENILHLADPGFSSWSMRVWLILSRTGIPHRVEWHRVYGDPPLAAQIGQPPARTVPVLVTDGVAIRDSLAIAEEVASRYPDADVWPADPARRALARSLAAEMHSGFAALRGDCPMCLRTAYCDVPVGDGVLADLRRLEDIWSDALDRSGGPWLAGAWSAADAFYAPVAARIAGYGLPLTRAASVAYVNSHLTEPSFREWRRMGLQIGEDLHYGVYSRPFPRVAWPDSINRA
ncbi:glutathione S-transferase [Palleronia abyssalis]|uniref:GST N-terminal domain-containing protein n=1 Tax=Palleronia abyssalis TaxID=1501240 RepID=A0A2R8BY60_9RHOB|nr:glutathione S-transferase [Palleronia abyssalis]SPJ25091.1 hypothetical protein PAA8504_02936 [Palleronia abyssalis]